MSLEELDIEKEAEKDPQEDQIKKFLDLVKRSSKPCPDEDCEEITCKKCGGSVKTIFGSLPLKVVCKECGKEFLLRDMVD